MNDQICAAQTVSRREFMARIGGAGMMMAASPAGPAAGPAYPAKRAPVCIFSKHLQWLDYDGMAEAAATVGFDGVELTVRPAGHVLPERVVDDLPRAAEAIRKAGIAVNGLTSNITDPRDPLTEPILKTAALLGITHYRLGYLQYTETDPIPAQLEAFRPWMRDLAAMNQHYRIFGGMHNHTGMYVGGNVWDTWDLLKGLDPHWLGFQFDTGNAFQAGRDDTWKTQALLAAPAAGMVAVKTAAEWADPAWRSAKPSRLGPWNVLVYQQLLWFFTMLKARSFAGPICAHFEYEGLGGADTGKTTLTGVTQEEVFKAFRHNLGILRDLLAESGLA